MRTKTVWWNTQMMRRGRDMSGETERKTTTQKDKDYVSEKKTSGV